jgi:hypothetical protein
MLLVSASVPSAVRIIATPNRMGTSW